MKRNLSVKRVLLLSVCAAAAWFGIAADHPHRTVPIAGTFGTSFNLIPTATPGVFHNSIQGVGNVPRLGVCTVVIDETVDLRTVPAVGVQDWVLTFADGSQLTASLQGDGTFDQTDPAFVKIELRGTITGGTGRFQDATGELHGPGVAHADTTPGFFPAQGHGTLALEGILRHKKQ